MADLAARIEELWDNRAELAAGDAEADAVVTEAVDLLDTGAARVAEVVDDAVVVHEWLKKAILLLFKLRAMETTTLGPFEYHDKIPLKTGFAEAGVRVVPGASARWGSFIEAGAILMPSYVNIGARVGSGTMVDTWATIATCAQVGRDVHISGGVGLGGVLEPPQASPVIIEDDCMIGSRCIITQGARVGRGSILGEGTLLNPGIPVIDAQTGEEVARGIIPPDSVVMRAERKREFPGGEFYLPCALIVRRLQPGDRDHVNDILRETGITVS
jgi:2,3,4,5-tetrahydropyridine-2,6-dicarboxylate N-succinyltransferase